MIVEMMALSIWHTNNYNYTCSICSNSDKRKGELVMREKKEKEEQNYKSTFNS